MTPMDKLHTIARSLRGPVERLDSLVVPLSTTFKDSEGKYVLTYEQARGELVMRLRETAVAVNGALEVLQ